MHDRDEEKDQAGNDRECSLIHRLSTFTTNLDFSGAAACRTITAATACGTSRFVCEYDHSVGDFLSRSFSFPVANRTIPVARGITIGAGVSGHTPRPNDFRDSDLLSPNCQIKTRTEKVKRRRTVVRTVREDTDRLGFRETEGRHVMRGTAMV